MGIRGAINSLSIQSLARFTTAVIVLIVVIGLGVNFTFTNNINKLNEEWRSHSQSTLKKTTYLSLMRQSLGYGGMIHHFKNFVLRGDVDDLVEAHFHILELRAYISAYVVVGANEQEVFFLGVLEETIDKYFNALSQSEVLKQEGLFVAQIDELVYVDDRPAFDALLTLESTLFKEREGTQQTFSDNVNRLAYVSSLAAIFETIAFAIFVLIIGWVFRRRIVAIYAREVEGKKKSDEERMKIDTVVNSISEGIVTIDSKGVVLSVNNAILGMYGYAREQIIGNNVKMLVPAPHYARHDQYLKSYLKTGQAKIIGSTRELQSVRANNQPFPIDLNISEMEVAGDRHFVGTIRDITDRKAADRAKKHFIATVSHELRTPLTAIQGALGMVSTGVLGNVPDKIENLIDVALNNTRRLVTLVNDLLDLEKLDAGQMNFDYAEHALSEIIGNAYYSNLPYADKYGVKLDLTGKGRGLNVWADSKRLEQVITNLLSNAIKFSPKGETVVINFFNNDGVARVEVTDRGGGIPKGFQEVIFKRFSQADNSDTRAKGGTGLGLSISKVIVENHGGKIGFETKEGEGTTFYFELPTYKKKKNDELELNEEYLKRSIVIVEDTNPQADRLSENIGTYGFSPIAVGNLAQARNQMHSSQVDTLIVDLDHVSLAKALDMVDNIRLSNNREKFPIVFISEDVERYKNEASASRFEVNLWLKKPFDMREFITVLDEIVNPYKNIKSKILLIDNDDGFSIRLKKHMEDKAGVTIATSVFEAKLCYDHINFDLYIIDPEAIDGNFTSLHKDLNVKAKTDSFAVVYYSSSKVKKSIKSLKTLQLDKNKCDFNEVLSSINDALAAVAEARSDDQHEE